MSSSFMCVYVAPIGKVEQSKGEPSTKDPEQDEWQRRQMDAHVALTKEGDWFEDVTNN